MAHEQDPEDTHAGGSVSAPRELVTTRLGPPEQNNRLFERKQLLEDLAKARARLVLLEAPAGYGKTTLLAQWRDRLLQQGAKVAWLTQDRTDSSISESLSFIEHALRSAGVGRKSDVEAQSTSSDIQSRIHAVLNGIAATGQRVVLILDESENAPAGLMEAVIEPMLRRAPADLQIVLASRVRLELRIAALRAQGLVIRLSTDELCCSSAEIAQIFDCKLNRRELTTVVEATRGWPAAAQVIRGAWSRGTAVRPEDCCVLPDIVDYVNEEVLSTLPREQRQLLFEIAVLDHLSEDGVVAVTARPTAWQELLASEQLRYFLMPDRDPQTRLLHPILRAVCAAEFPAVDPARRADVLRAAARWYARQGQLVRAVSLALQCGDDELAGALILGAGGVHLWIRHGKTVMKGIDAMLEEPLLDRFPRIRLLRSLMQIKNGQLSAGRRSFDQVREATAGFKRSSPDDQLAALRREALIVEATLLMNECQPASDAYLESFQRAMSELAGDHQPLHEEDHLLRGQWRNMFCLVCVQRGMFEKAAAAAHAAIDEYRRGGSTHGQLFEHLHLGEIGFAQGMPAVAKAAYARSRELARRHFPEDQTKSVLLNALSAELAYEQNLLGNALRLTRQAASHIPHAELWYDIYAAQFVTSTLLALDRNGIAEALAMLDAAKQEAAERNAGGIYRLLDATRVSCLALAGVGDEAHEVMRQRDLDVASYLAAGEERIWREQEAVLVAGIRVATSKPVVPLPVAQVEERLSKVWSGKQVRAAIRLSSALAAFYWSRGRSAPALAHFDNALRASQRSGYVRAFIEDRDHLRPVLQRWRSDAHDDADANLVTHADALLANIGTTTGAPVALTALTDREGEILQEISRGRSDKEIARALRLSENTVKFHLKNLYAKLQVGRRIDAVQQARLRGIVH